LVPVGKLNRLVIGSRTNSASSNSMFVYMLVDACFDEQLYHVRCHNRFPHASKTSSRALIAFQSLPTA
jgi:hypothetical protein